MTTTSSADPEAREESAPLSEPCLARRAPADLMVYSTKRPPSIRMAAHTSVPPQCEPSVSSVDGIGDVLPALRAAANVS